MQETADSLAKQAMSIGNYSAFCGCIYDQGDSLRQDVDACARVVESAGEVQGQIVAEF